MCGNGVAIEGMVVLVLLLVLVGLGLGCRRYGLDCGCGILQRLP